MNRDRKKLILKSGLPDGERNRRMWRIVMLLVYTALLACTITYVVLFAASLIMVNRQG